jgi:hypothetical protein
MKRKFIWLLASVFLLLIFFPAGSKASQWSDTYTKYTNPHSICNYYKTQPGYSVYKESDTECDVSNNAGIELENTRFYKDTGQWCYDTSKYGGRANYSGCILDPAITKYIPILFGTLIVMGLLGFILIYKSRKTKRSVHKK